MSSKQAYLAERYMSGPKADAILARVAQKKKKRKTDALSSSGVAAAAVRLCDDDGGWGDEGKDEGDDISEAVVTTDRGFKKRRVEERDSGWATIREGERQPKLEPELETETGEEKPLIVDEQSAQAPFVGGLLTSKQLRSTLPRTKVVTDISKEEMAVAQETVYRDASGRKIDTKAERAEAARKKREREEKEAEKMEWGKGIVQREEQERRKLELEKQRTTAFARHADDTELNEELKARDRWNDPAAAFLTKKQSKGPRKPEYNGPPPPPNRFGIKPGYRWDGVDRSNGFEKKYFQRQNEQSRRKHESHVWSVEDM